MTRRVGLEEYLREVRVCARVGDLNGLEMALVGALGEVRRRRNDHPTPDETDSYVDVDPGVGVVPDGGEVDARRDSPAWSDDELRRLSPAEQQKVTRLTELEQRHLSEFGGGAWR